MKDLKLKDLEFTIMFSVQFLAVSLGTPVIKQITSWFSEVGNYLSELYGNNPIIGTCN